MVKLNKMKMLEWGICHEKENCFINSIYDKFVTNAV